MKKLLVLALALCLILGNCAFAEIEYKSRENWPITTEDVTITIMGPKAPQHVEWADMDLWKTLSEETGLKFKFITPPSGDFKEQLNLTLSSGDLPDMVICTTFTPNEIVKYGVEQGLLVALDEYFDYAPNIQAAYEQYPDVYACAVAEDGHIYTQTMINVLNWTVTSTHLYLNTTWLERIGKEMPTTTEEYLDVLRAFKEEDANGNGDPNDEIPLGGDKSLAWRTNLLSAFGLCTNGFEITRDGEIVYSPITENWKAYLKYMKQLWDEGLMDIDMFSQDGNAGKARAAEDLYGSFSALASFVYAPSTMLHDFDIVIPLTSEMNDKPLQRSKGGYTLGTAAIFKTSKHIEECMMLLDWTYTQEGVMWMSYGPHNYGFTEAGAHYFILEDGTAGADDMYRGTLTIGPGTTLPINYRASADSYAAFYSDAENNYNNSVLYDQMLRGAFPFMHLAQPQIVWTSEEAEAMQNMTDLQTYVDTMEAQFITGAADIDAEWDQYVENVKSYSYDDIYAAYVSGWTRYLEATK